MATKKIFEIAFPDPLQAVFGRKLSRREVIWLWLTLRDERPNINLGEFDSEDMEAQMANLVLGGFSRATLLARLRTTLLPEENLEWIKNDRRQLKWLEPHLLRIFFKGRLDIPASLTRRERIVATLDWSDVSLEDKIHYVNRAKEDWALLQGEDKFFSWFETNGNTKLKCQLAWDWYQTHHPNPTYSTRPPRFSSVEEILIFLDASRFEIDEKRFHVEEIKKEWKRNQVKKNLNGKKQTNLALSDEARRKLDQLAEMWGQTMVTVVERLILEAHKENAENFAQSKKFRV